MISRSVTALVLLLFTALPLHAETDRLGDSDVMGTIRLLVFNAEDGTPVPDVRIRVLQVTVGRTNADGAATIELMGGLYHLILDTGDEIHREIALRVAPERTVEAIASIRLHSDEVVLLEERPAGQTEVAPDADTGPMSAIEGRLIHEETREGIADARIFVRGLPIEAKTDARGDFRIEVPAGTHDVVIVHAEFGTVTKSGVEVPPDRPAEITVETSPVGVELEAFTVTAPRIEGSTVDILKERQETSQVSDVIGAEQMSKSGDSSAAAALKRVTGVTIVGGKYVYVRGLGERYSATRLNGLGLPSPDPERRVVPLDMFPAAILDSMVIQKTFSPDMPGEFGGGVVDLRTKGYPDELTLKLDVSGDVTTGTTFTNANFGTDKGPTDFLGIDGGHRGLPKVVKDATANGQALEKGDMFHDGYSEEELAAFSRAMPKNWGIDKRTIPPGYKVTLTGGNGWKIKKNKLGFLSSVLYKNDWDTNEEVVRDYTISNAELALNNVYKFYDTTNTITLGGILALGVDLSKGHSIKANTIVNRITDNTYWRYQGRSFDTDATIRVHNFEWTERMIFTQQVIGKHLLSKSLGLSLDWRYAFAKAERDEPDKRFIRYNYRPEGDYWQITDHPNGNRRDYLHVDDKGHDMGLDFSLPFKQWTEEEGLVKAGAAVFIKDRYSDVRRFKFENISALSVPARSVDPADFYIDANMSPDGMVLTEATRATDNYTGEHDIFAGYLLSEVPLGLGFKATGGLRLEKSDQQVATFDILNRDNREKTRINELDVLPSLVLIYEINPEMLIRVGYGRTVNRPDFSEMSPGCQASFIGGYDLCGVLIDENDDLPDQINRAVIHNVDARWEWYPSEGESISFGGFYKQFIDPLERVIFSGADKLKYIMNTDGARNFGLELDVRKNLDFITDVLRDVYIAGNATWVYSRVVIPKTSRNVQTNRKRALQGQSPYIFNVQLGYDNADIGTSAVLLYNVFGKRISDVGASGAPDVYEQPFHQLDFVVKQKIKSHWSVGFKAQNLIDASVTFLQGGKVRNKYKKGRHFTLSAGYSY